MEMLLHKKSAWWKEPMVWLIIALPLSAVIGGALTVWFATDKPDTLVSADYHKEGMAVLRDTARERAAVELGISARLEAADDGILTLSLRGRYAEPPRRLSLTLVHPSDSSADITLDMPAAGAGLYRVSLPPVATGKRRLILEPGDQAWRLAGQWHAPFAGTLDLAAADPTDSSTRP